MTKEGICYATSIATVDSAGIVSGISPGQTIISVSYNGTLLATCSVTVDKKSAYKQLTERDKVFVDAFLKYIDNVQNPSELKITAIQGPEEKYRIWKFTVALSGGGSQNYRLFDDEGWDTKGFSKMGSNPVLDGYMVADSSYNVSLISEAIREKYNDMQH